MLEPKCKQSNDRGYKSQASHDCSEGKADLLLGTPVQVEEVWKCGVIIHY